MTPKKKLDPAIFGGYPQQVAKLSREELEQLCCVLLMTVNLTKEYIADVHTLLAEGPDVLVEEVYTALKKV